MLDAYNNDIQTEVAVTISTRIYASNNHWIMETQDIQKELSIISPGHGYFEGRESSETAPTVKCSAMQAQHFVSNGIRIRSLTERELYRLMDVDESDIDTLLNAGIPKSQLAKLAGNSIVVSCLYHIFRTLFIDREPQQDTQLQLF